MARLLANDEVRFVGQARLLDIDFDVAKRVHDAKRFVRQPAAIGIGDQDFTRLKTRGDMLHTCDVGVDIASDLELEAAVAVGAIKGDALRHALGRVLRDGAIACDALALPAAEQRANGDAGDLAENVPARHVDRRFHIRMALEISVHQPGYHPDFGRVRADQMRAELRNARAHPLRIGRQIGGAERAHFAIADDVGIGLDPHDRRIVGLDRAPAGKAVAALAERQFDPVRKDALDFHLCSLPDGRL